MSETDDCTREIVLEVVVDCATRTADRLATDEVSETIELATISDWIDRADETPESDEFTVEIAIDVVADCVPNVFETSAADVCVETRLVDTPTSELVVLEVIVETLPTISDVAVDCVPSVVETAKAETAAELTATESDATELAVFEPETAVFDAAVLINPVESAVFDAAVLI